GDMGGASELFMESLWDICAFFLLMFLVDWEDGVCVVFVRGWVVGCVFGLGGFGAVGRCLLKRNRMSVSYRDLNDDGARSMIFEEVIATWIFIL
ncbi:hypothetical protein RA272_28540, partial [Pseudomonas syringae pv. tagetis]